MTVAFRPSPLVPADVDVAGLDSFMLNVERVMGSELWALSTGDEFKAAFSLWCRAWKQHPPGSLPNDDKILAAFSGAGAKWRKLKAMALRGFVECDDGRLYHKVLCQDVVRAAKAKTTRAARAEAAKSRWSKPDANGHTKPPANTTTNRMQNGCKTDPIDETGHRRDEEEETGTSNQPPSLVAAREQNPGVELAAEAPAQSGIAPIGSAEEEADWTEFQRKAVVTLAGRRTRA